LTIPGLLKFDNLKLKSYKSTCGHQLGSIKSLQMGLNLKIVHIGMYMWVDENLLDPKSLFIVEFNDSIVLQQENCAALPRSLTKISSNGLTIRGCQIFS
jgi:hypothetical protein